MKNTQLTRDKVSKELQQRLEVAKFELQKSDNDPALVRYVYELQQIQESKILSPLYEYIR